MLIAKRGSIPNLPVLFSLLSLMSLNGCYEDPSGDLSISSSKSAMTDVQQRILGFEDPVNDWSSAGSIDQSNDSSQGQSALSVLSVGWTEISNVPISSVGQIENTISLDFKQPSTAPWGNVHLIVKVPSRDVAYQEIGNHSIQNLDANVYHTLVFQVPQNVLTALDGDYDDLQFTIALNADPGSGPYLFDNLQITQSGDVDADSDNEPDTEEESAVEGNLSLSIPAEVGLHQVTLGASDSMRVADFVSIIGENGQGGSVTCTGTGLVEVLPDCVIDGHVLSRGRISLKDRVLVHGNVKSEDAIDAPTAFIEGEVVPNTDIEVNNRYAWQVEFPPAISNVALEPDKNRNLPPGSYGAVSIKPRSRLTLSPGVYYFDSLMADAESILEVASGGEPVILYIRSSMTTRAMIFLNNSPGDFLIGYLGTGTADLDSPFSGTVVAPNATIRLAPLNGGQHRGSFFGKRIEAEAQTPILHDGFDHWDHIFPPVVTLECVSRSARRHAAGLFSYENILDIPVRIDKGPRNYVETPEARQGPLQVFEPGVHSKVYWLPYIGDYLNWTLSGNTVSVDNSARGCTLDDYTIRAEKIELPVDTTTSPIITDAEMADHTPTTGWTFDSEPDDAYIPPSNPGNESFRIRLFNWGIGGDGFGTLDLDLVTDIDEDRFREDLYTGGWQAEGIVIGDIVYNVPVPGNDPFLIEVHLIDRDVTNDDDHFIVLYLWVDAQTGEILTKAAYNKDGGSATIDGTCAKADGWRMCFDVIKITEKPKVCMQWKTQFIDADIGESYIPSNAVLGVPASFANVKLGINDAVAPFQDWTGYFPLDKDGCVPKEYAPNLDQIDGGGAVAPQITVDVKGTLAGNWSIPASGSATVRVTNDDSEVFGFRHLHTVTQNKPSSIDILLSPLNEFTKAAATASHLLKRQAEGHDMGLPNGGTLNINTVSSQAITATPNHSYGTIHLRADPDVAGPGGMSHGDASYKFVTGHEMGHYMMWTGTRKWNYLNYVFTWLDEDGEQVIGAQPESTPDECRCHVNTEYSPLHCIQSLENPNTAQIEGFSNFYSAKLWNDAGKDDGWYSYVKWVYGPECPENTTCHPANALTPDIIAKLHSYPQKPKEGWSMIESPVPIPAKGNDKYLEWVRWRNNYCLGDNPTPDLLALGTEMDWMRFYWGIHKTGDGPQRWAMNDIYTLYDEVVHLNPNDPSDVSHATDTQWGFLLDETMASGTLTQQQKQYFASMGNEHGVNMNAAP